MILLGCSDAGPAKYIAELVKMIPHSAKVAKIKIYFIDGKEIDLIFATGERIIFDEYYLKN